MIVQTFSNGIELVDDTVFHTNVLFNCHVCNCGIDGNNHLYFRYRKHREFIKAHVACGDEFMEQIDRMQLLEKNWKFVENERIKELPVVEMDIDSIEGLFGIDSLTHNISGVDTPGVKEFHPTLITLNDYLSKNSYIMKHSDIRITERIEDNGNILYLTNREKTFVSNDYLLVEYRKYTLPTNNHVTHTKTEYKLVEKHY